MSSTEITLLPEKFDSLPSRSVDPMVRLAASVSVDPDTGCWRTSYAPDPKTGYVSLWVNTGLPRGITRKVLAHRLMYEQTVGEIPPGMVIDHLCRNHWCVKPNHLEAVTPRMNAMRGKNSKVVAYLTNTCHKGHSLLDAYVDKRGWRNCRVCAKERYEKRKNK